MNKILTKKVVFCLVVVLVLFAGGFFYWQSDKIENFLERKELERMVALSGDYLIMEDSGEKFIINKKDELKIKVPAQWEIVIGMDMFGLTSERHVTLHSQDFSYRPPKGCLVEIQISRLQDKLIDEHDGNFEMFLIDGVKEVKEIINFYKENEPEEKEVVRIISVNHNEALQETKMLKEDMGEQISIKIPTENRVYVLEGIFFSEECGKKFEQFLETVSIE
ncbi:MAG: hypothetical protein ABIG08_02925 [bacterium]